MGTQGVKLNIPKSALIASLKKNKGRTSYCARELDCHHSSLRKLIDSDPELVQLQSDLRNDFQENRLDLAEETVDSFVINIEKDPTLAFKAACFFLNNHGKERGYSHSNAPIQIGINPHALGSAIQDCQTDSKQTIVGEQELEITQPILDKECSRGEGQVCSELGTEDPLAGFAPV